jgi:hypothetical protein
LRREEKTLKVPLRREEKTLKVPLRREEKTLKVPFFKGDARGIFPDSTSDEFACHALGG